MGLKTNRLSVRTVFLVIFVLVSSGPFGVEEMVRGSGPGVALLLILLIPLLWGIPFALICTELASAIPDEGGSYVWIEPGLGRFWAFQSGWWLTLSGLLDTAVYVVLAVAYADSWLGLEPLGRWLLSLAVIAAFATLNTIPVVVAVYFLPTAAALASVGRWSEWGEGGVTLVQVGGELGGTPLAVELMAAALVSSLALYNAYLASGARTTLVMARSGLLPRVFGLVPPRFGTPHGSILIAAGLPRSWPPSRSRRSSSSTSSSS